VLRRMKLLRLDKKTWLTFTLTFWLLLSCHFFFVKSLKILESEERRLSIAPPKSLTNFAFGYSEIVADVLWLRAIQDFDYCSQPVGKSSAGFVICTHQSWLYQHLDVLTDLSPDFRMPLATGPLALSVIINDREGASLLFNKATAAFPTDWRILYRAAYHAMMEEKKHLKAAGLLKVAASNGGPPWLNALAGRMFVQGGAVELGSALVAELERAGDPDSLAMAERIRARIRETGP
jgi:hypothetical protein